MVRCSKCGTQNKIPPEKHIAEAKCGKCGTALKIDQDGADAGQSVLFRCTACRTRNRIPPDKIDAGAKCGKCGQMLKTEELFMTQPLMLSESNFDTLVLNSPLPVLVYAWATWCPTCKTAMPAIDEFAKDATGKIRVGKLNVDSNQALAAKYNILSLPHILIFDNGQLKETMPGAMQKHDIMIKMAAYL